MRRWTKIRDLVKAESGPEIGLRSGGACTFDIDIKDEKKSAARNQEDEWTRPRNPVKMSGSRKMDVDAAIGISENQFGALWKGVEEEIQCQECSAGLRWR